MPAWTPSGRKESDGYWPWPRLRGFALVFGAVAGISLGLVLAVIMLVLTGR